MALKLKCPACGKKHSFGEAEAGLPAKCTACGSRIQIPCLPTIDALPFVEEETVPTSGHWRPVLWIVSSAAGCVVCLLVSLIFLAARPSWESAHRKQLLDMKAEAEQLTADYEFAEAHQKYRDIQELVGGRRLSDPQLREQMERAAAAQDAVLDMILHRQPEPMDFPAAQVDPPAATRPAPTATVAVAATLPTVVAVQPATLPATRTTVAATLPVVPPVAATRQVVEPPVVRRPPIRKTTPRVEGVTDEEIGTAIQKGVDFMVAQFEKGKLKQAAGNNGAYATGLDSLCVYALLQCGDAIKDDRLNRRGPFMRGLVSVMKEMPADGGPVTYTRALRASALALMNRPEDRKALEMDVKWLIGAANHGGYTYDDRFRRIASGQDRAPLSGVWDNSNSQYGLLGVWSGAEVGVEVPQMYWQDVENHWAECQMQTGEWGYGLRQSGYLSMTLAGTASMFVTHDYLDAPKVATTLGLEPFSKPLAKALAWLETGDNAMEVDKSHWGAGYTLYGVERVGLASGFKYFGKHDWYRELARLVVDRQFANGSWARGVGRGGVGRRVGAASENDLVESAYMLLFLSRGRHPILMNKLRFDGYWANRPRDAANLARFAGRELERPLNHQIVGLDHDWTDWLDSPILYIASHQAPVLKETDYDKLRGFVDSGGLIFTQADGGSPAFNAFVRDLVKKIFPYELQDLPQDHEIYTIDYKLEMPRPALKCVTNGSRLLLIHSPTDISVNWQQRADKTQRALFELGTNMFIYAAGKADLRNRLSSSYLPEPPTAPTGTVRFARVRYGGNWQPELYAHVRFSRYFQYETGMSLDVTTRDLKDLTLQVAPIAHMTGNVPYTLNDAERKALRAYVEAGGVLVVDACGGAWQFASGLRIALEQLAPEARMRYVSRNHPLLAGKGEGMDDLTQIALRQYTVQKMGQGAGRLEIMRLGQGAVILSSVDITSGLLGTKTWGILGYEPGYCQSLLKNVVLWTADGAKEEQ